MSWGPRRKGEGQKAEMCVSHKRDRWGLKVRFQCTLQLCLWCPKIPALGLWLLASAPGGMFHTLFESHLGPVSKP